ncbi:MAG: serine hydrolase [Cyclobacteriaceae bacterium]
MKASFLNVKPPNLVQFYGMQVVKQILTLALIISAQFAIGSVENRADSAYSIMDNQQRISQLIWVDEHVSAEALQAIDFNFGGVYHTDEFITRGANNQLHAFQLTDQLISSDKPLPSLATLSTIRDNDLFNEYCQILRQSGKHNGYHYLVLPELKGDQSYLSTTLERIKSFDSLYFIMMSDLDFEPPTKRKEFYQTIGDGKAVVLANNNLLDYGRALKKIPKDVNDIKPLILAHLKTLVETRHLEEPVVTPSFLFELWTQSIVPLQSNKNILPLKTDTVGIWVSRESSALKTEIGKYFSSTLNLKYDNIPHGIPVIIDARSNPIDALEYALAFQAFNPIIWIGETKEITNVNAAAILCMNEQNELHNRIIPEMLVGAHPISGKNVKPLPPYLTDYLNDPIVGQKILGFAEPEWVGSKSNWLDSIDAIATEMINKGASPGGQVLIARQGKIIYNKAFGYLTYDSLIKVHPHTLYDLASLTKTTSTLLAIMKLVENNQLHLDSSIAYYHPAYKTTNKSHITIRQLLAHQSGIQTYIPFWKRSLNGDMMETFYYRSTTDKDEDNRSYGYEPHPVMRDSLESWIRASSLRDQSNPKYRYSDIGFMMLHQLVEEVTQKTFDDFLFDEFYGPLGLDRTHFNPLNKGFEIYEIAPTEYDYYLREEQVWGNVHDRNAVVFGGVAGHAGLFSTAKDLATLMQMIVQNGYYGGKRYLKPETINYFNQQYFARNRRGLGWDKPGNYNPNISKNASKSSFGHTGFTGTMVWADPKEDLVYIFLSNRIFPDSRNNKLITLDIRRRIHDMVYRSLMEY